MCMALYAVALALVALGVAAARRFDGDEAGAPLFAKGMLAAVFAGAFVAVGAIAAATWPSADALPPDAATYADVERADPEFVAWYESLPKTRVKPRSSAHRTGNPGAPVVIVEFSDFACAYCRANHKLLAELVARRPEDVVVVHQHFPLDAACNEAVERSIHPNACRAAEAAECAGKQGRYDDMATVLFENQRQLFEENLPRLAKKIGLDEQEFRRCMETRETLPGVVADARAGKALKLTSTPTLFVNGRRVKGTFAEASHYDLAVLVESVARD